MAFISIKPGSRPSDVNRMIAAVNEYDNRVVAAYHFHLTSCDRSDSRYEHEGVIWHAKKRRTFYNWAENTPFMEEGCQAGSVAISYPGRFVIGNIETVTVALEQDSLRVEVFDDESGELAWVLTISFEPKIRQEMLETGARADYYDDLLSSPVKLSGAGTVYRYTHRYNWDAGMRICHPDAFGCQANLTIVEKIPAVKEGT